MGLWLRGLCITVASLFAWSGAARADDPVVLKASLAEGQVLRYDIEAKLEVKGSAEPQTVTQKLRLRFTVAHAGKAGAVVRCRVESARVSVKSPGQEADEFVWTEGDGPGGDDESALAHLYRKLGAAMLELSLTEHGAVTSVSGLDPVAKAGVPVRWLGILTPDSAGRMLQGIFTMDPDGRAHSAGQRWSFSQEIPSGVWITTANTEFTLKEAARGAAKITGLTTITPHQPTPSETDTHPRLEITAQSIKTDAEWDTGRGQLIQRTTVGAVEMKSTLLLKEPIVATSTSTSRIVFTRVAGRPDPAK